MNDWTLLIKNAISVLIILLSVSVVIFLTYLGLNAANRGGENMSSKITTLDSRTVEAYNQKTISGATVISAVQNLADSDIAVMVRTRADTVVRIYGPNLISPTENEPGNGPHLATLEFNAFGDSIDLTNADLLFSAVTGTQVRHTISAYRTNGRLAPMSRNKAVGLMTSGGNAQYVNPTDKFRSVLVYDLNDEIVGIYMEQIGIPDFNDPSL